MILMLSKGNKLKKELYHLYLHRTLTWSQVVGILEKSYEVKAVCIDFRGSSIEDEDLINIETLRLARVPLCIIVDEDLQVEGIINLSNESYGFDISVQVAYDDIGLAEYLSYLIGVDITNKVVRFVEDSKKAETDLGDEGKQKPLEMSLTSEQEIIGVGDFELDFENMDFDFKDLDVDYGGLDDIPSDDDLLGDLDEEDILAGLDEIDI